MMGMEALRRRLNDKRKRVLLRYKYYEMKYAAQDLGISTPDALRGWMSVLGWCGKAADSIADRLVFRGFGEGSGQIFDFPGIFNMNNPDTFFDSAFLSALISACCFVYISADEAGFPRLQVLDGANATGDINPITGLLNEGYAVLKRDPENDENVITEAYFTPTQTEFWTAGEKKPLIYPHKAGHPLLVPVVYRPDARRPFGHSRITRACMDIVQSALRTVKRSEISAEFYSFPQKYVLGTDPSNEPLEKWKATISTMMEFTKDEEGDHPVVGQFSQQSMEPHLAQLRMFAGMFAGETGLTLDDMGFPSENPSSSEAIRASHENLRLTAEKAKRTFGVGIRNTGFLAACVRDDHTYLRHQFSDAELLWDPIFSPDASQLAGIGDAVGKIQTAFPEYFNEKKLRNLTGI